MQVLQAKQRNGVVRVRFAADSANLYGLLARPRRLTSWNLISGESEEVSYCPAGCAELELSPFGEMHIQGCSDGTAYITRLQSDQVGIPLAVNPRWNHPSEFGTPLVAVCSHPERRWIGATGRELWLWNQLTQEYIVAPEEGDYTGLAFHPDGERVYFVETIHGVQCAQIKPFRMLEKVFQPEGPMPVSRLAISGDGAVLVAWHAGTLMFFDLNRGTQQELRLRGHPADLVFLPGTRIVGLATNTEVVTLVDADTAAIVKQFQWNIGQVRTVAFSPDGTLGAAGGTQGRIVVWDAQ